MSPSAWRSEFLLVMKYHVLLEPCLYLRGQKWLVWVQNRGEEREILSGKSGRQKPEESKKTQVEMLRMQGGGISFQFWEEETPKLCFGSFYLRPATVWWNRWMGPEEAGWCQPPKCEMRRAFTRTVEMGVRKKRCTEGCFDMVFTQHSSM